MKFCPYVLDRGGNHIPVTISPMTDEDAEKTNVPPIWQSSWTSDFLSNARFERYAAKIENELIALAAYEIQRNSLVVHIVYMESAPDSNPVMDGGAPKYTGIGKLLIAYGIKLSVDNGFAGDVTLDAKTSELEAHYIRDFGAVRLPIFASSAPQLLIADEAAKNIFLSYLKR